MRDALVAQDLATTSQVVDSYKYAASMVSRVVSNGYIGMVKTIPQMYRFLYSRAERATEVGPFRNWIHQFTATNLRSLMERTKPEVVVCTHAFPCGVMSEYKKEFADAPPVFGVVTDFVVHSFWIHRNIDGYAVATSEMRTALRARGVQSKRIIVSGIPIDQRFGRQPGDREVLRDRLGIPSDRFAVLMMGGGLGIGPLVMMMRALDSVKAPVSATVIAGRSEVQQQRILEAAQHVNYPVRVLRFVNNVYDYMHASDVLLSKPGGLTSAEALASGLPMILVRPLPGQEERNTRYLVERKAARRSKGERDLASAVQEILENPKRRESMRAAALALGKPDAAADIARFILQTSRPPEERTPENALRN
ncbi:MAG: hypothetical protein DLM50_09675 [Candidatus Meridianibacter frigidus]|nr:MAG: hypothetical protein DLM50_09675 [Candidatus Eremiobacteraeota bacterium]